MRDFSRAPRTYELLTILTPDVPEEAIPESLEQIASYISNAGGTVTETLRESPWGRRRLAYAIRHAGRDVRDGFYTLFHFDLDPGKVIDIERDLRLNDHVIRHLVTHYIARPVEELEATDAADDAASSEAVPADVAGDETVAATSESPVAEAEATEEPAAEPEVDEAVLPEEPQSADTTADDDSVPGEPDVSQIETDEADEK